MVRITCPKCQGLLVVDDEMAGRVLACPDCATTFRVPTNEFPPLLEPGQIKEGEPQSGTHPVPALARVRMNAKGRWQVFDARLPISIDGRQVAFGSAKKGFDFVIKVSVGLHRVEIGSIMHTLEFPEEGDYEVEFEYSVAWGNYSNQPTVHLLEPGDADDWPTKNTAIDLEGDGPSPSPQDLEVLAELERLRNQRPSWTAAIGMLIVSLLLFMGAARTQEIWESIFILIPVLFFHELGHYVTMRLFGYRNLRMFFIPFFGAAVTGQHYNIEGWKKAVVALAGPLPGILVGIPIGIAGLIFKQPTVIEVALMLQILNGFNLLPFLPLDGGQVVQSILFVRHPVLDLLFRLCAALAMLGLAYFVLSSWCLIVLAVFMLLATPFAFRQARIAQRLREQGLAARSLDAHTIPPETALQILAELRRGVHAQTGANLLAQNVAQIFETCNAEPPGIVGSLVLLAIHSVSFLAALVMLVLLDVLRV